MGKPRRARQRKDGFFLSLIFEENMVGFWGVFSIDRILMALAMESFMPVKGAMGASSCRQSDSGSLDVECPPDLR